MAVRHIEIAWLIRPMRARSLILRMLGVKLFLMLIIIIDLPKKPPGPQAQDCDAEMRRKAEGS